MIIKFFNILTNDKMFDSFSSVTGPIGTVWMIYVTWKIFRYFTTEKSNASLDKYRDRKNTIVIGHLTSSQSIIKSVVNDNDDSISINTFEEVSSQLKKIRKTDGPLADIEIILHTPGGSLFYSQLIANMIRHWKGRTVARIVGYSASGGTIIALACDKIIMAEDSALGPIDPQMASYDVMSGKMTMSFSFQEGYEMFTDRLVTIDEKNFKIEILKRRTLKTIPPYLTYLNSLLIKNYSDQTTRQQIINFFMADRAHGLPIFYESCVEIGLKVMPEEAETNQTGYISSNEDVESKETDSDEFESLDSSKETTSSDDFKEAKNLEDSTSSDDAEPSFESFQKRLKELQSAVESAKATGTLCDARDALWVFMNNNDKYLDTDCCDNTFLAAD